MSNSTEQNAQVITPLIIKFETHADPATYLLTLQQAANQTAAVPIALPYSADTSQSVQEMLENASRLDDQGQAQQILQAIGQEIASVLLAHEEVAQFFDSALTHAENQRQPLPIELHFGMGCQALAALPWELLYHKGRFILADTTITLLRVPESQQSPMLTQAKLPLRVLLILSEPLDQSPIFPQRTREELLHGLRSLDEAGAVIVDLLQPPTYSTLVEAVTNGGYHMVLFYGHGIHDPQQGGGQLLFEDEYGTGQSIPVADLSALLRNSSVRLVLLGACQSATVVMPAADLPENIPAEEMAHPTQWEATAAALVQAGVPLVIGMQVSMLVRAAQAFIRQFALSLAAGKPVQTAVAEARLPIRVAEYRQSWFIPALYGLSNGEPTSSHLFDLAQPLPAENAELRQQMQHLRQQIADLEIAALQQGTVAYSDQLAQLRQARRELSTTRQQLARYTPGGYAAVANLLYGVPSNPVFVGRRDELRQISRAFHQEQPIVIWGAGGLGKSALAQEIAHRQGWRFPAGILWLDCRGGPPFESLLAQIAAFCGMADLDQVPPDQKEQMVRAQLARLEQRALLIWDNAEDVWDDGRVRRFVRDGLPPNSQALLTMRQNPDQTMWPTFELAPLVDRAMNQLFYRMGETSQLKVNKSDLALIDPMLAWLEGHPLALTLIIPLVGRRGLRRTWDLLRRSPLKGVDAAFTVSYERLTQEQQRLFTRLSAFSIPFGWEAAAALLPEADPDDAEEMLDLLVQRALIQFDGARYSYHGLVRQYAYARLQALEDALAVHRLAGEYLHEKLTDPERGGTPDEGLERVDQWQRAEEWVTMARAANRLVGSLDRLGYWPEIALRQGKALDCLAAFDDEETQKLKSSLLNDQGSIAFKQAEWDKAITYYQQSLATFEQVGDSHGMASTYNNLGLVYKAKGEWDKAITYYQQSLATFEQVGDSHGMAQTYNNLGVVYQAKGEWDKAITYYQQSLATFEQVGDSHGRAQTYNNLGAVYQAKGEWDKAITYYQQSLATFEQVGDSHGMASTYNNLGAVYKDKGEWDKAITYYQQSLATFEQVGDSHGMASTYNNLGLVYKAKGEWDKAITYYQQSLATLEQVGDSHGMASTYNNLGGVYQAKGEWDKAITYYQQSLAIDEQVGDSHGMATTYNNLGIVYQAKGEWNKAITYYQQSLATKEQVGDSHGMATTYNNLGNVYQAKGEWNKAITYYQQSLATKEQVGDSHSMASTYNNLGGVYQAKGEWDKAITYYQQSLVIDEQVGDSHGMASTYNNLGNVYQAKGEWDKAITYYQQSLVIDEQVGDSHGMAQTYGNLGSFYQQQGDNEQAAAYVAKAFLTFAQLGAAETQQAGGHLVQILGSAEAANEYLAQMVATMENEG